MTDFKLKYAYIFLFFSALIAVEFNVPHIVGLKSSYIVLLVLMLVLANRLVQFVGIFHFVGFSRFLLSLYFFYYIFCFVSIIWSVSPIPTFIHSVLLLAVLIFSIGAVNFDTERSIDVLQKIILIFIALSWLALVVSPSFALQQKGIWRLKGIFFHEFELGFICSMLIIILCLRWCCENIRYYYKSSIQFYSIFGLSLITLIATQTRTLLAYTFLICLIALVFFAKGKKKLVTVFIFLAGISALIVFQDIFISAFSRGESDMTLSGRTVIWDRALLKADQQPILGHGFGSFTSPQFDADFLGNFGSYRAPHAHNTWIMAYFETGIIGATILTLFLFMQLLFGIRLLKRDKAPPYGLFFSLLATIGGLTSLVYAGKVAALAFLPLIFLLQRSREIGWNVFK